jgi:hypothetical protein
MVLVLRLLTRDWLRVMWLSLWLILVKETGLSVTAAMEQLQTLGKLSPTVQFVSTVGASLCQHHVHGGGAHHMLFAAVAELQKVNALQKTFAAAKHRGRRDQMDFINQSCL